jgi:hypothetical protein
MLALPDDTTQKTIDACLETLERLDPPTAWAWWASRTGEIARANTTVQQAVATLEAEANAALQPPPTRRHRPNKR